jgi:hypothetical protein
VIASKRGFSGIFPRQQEGSVMDRYTRIVLTLIAIALWVLVLKPVFFVEEAYAERQVVDVNITEIAGRGLYSKELPVDVGHTIGVRVNNASEIGQAVGLWVN